MANLTAQAIEFMLVTGMSDDPKQDVSQLPVMEQVAIYCMNYTQQQSDTLTTQQAALSQITDQINNNNYVSQLAEIRSKILSGNYSWPTDATTSTELVTDLDTDAAFGNWPTPPGPSASTLQPAISYDDYKKALSNGQAILSLLTPAPTDGTAADNTWPSDKTLAGALIAWCDAKGVTFPSTTLTKVGQWGAGLSKLPIPCLITTPNGVAFVDASGMAHRLTDVGSIHNVAVTNDGNSNADTSLATVAKGAVQYGDLIPFQTPTASGKVFLFLPNDVSSYSPPSSPAYLSTINGSGASLPVIKDSTGKTYIWTISTPIDYADPDYSGYLQEWVNGNSTKLLELLGDLVRYEPTPTPTVLQQWSTTFTAQQDTIDSNNRQLNSAAQSQMLEVQLAGTDYTNGQQYASGTLGKRNDGLSGVIRNF